MVIKKLLICGLASTLLLAACNTEDSDNGAVSESEDTFEDSSEIAVDVDGEDDVSGENDSVDTENGNEEDEVEEITVEDDDLPEQQVGDVIEEDGISRTVVAINYGINESVENGPFLVTLLHSQVSHLEIDDDETAEYFGGHDLVMVSMQLEVTNESPDTNNIYPDQSTIVTNTGKQVDSDIWMSDSIGGDFYGEVTKDGNVFFFFEGDPEEITNVRYIINSGHDDEYESFGDDIEFSVDY